MKLALLLELTLKHSYYGNGLCGDFDIVPDNTTERLLKNHRCTVKPKSNGLKIYIEIDDTGKPKILFSANSFRFQLRLNNPDFLLFTDSTPITDGPNFQITYPSQTADYYAAIEIQRNFNGSMNGNVEIAFSAKQVLWVYYLITDQSNLGESFSVALQDSHLTWKQEDGTESVFLKLADQYQGMKCLRFISEQLSPCQESGLQHIQLLLGGNTVIESLPNPSWRNYFQTEIANGGAVYAIYQIVKYLTNTTLLKV